MSTEQIPAAIDRGARALSYQAQMRDPLAPPTWWEEARECLSEALDVEEMAATIWEASRADESTISATGARIVAKVLRERMLGDARTEQQPPAEDVTAAGKAALDAYESIPYDNDLTRPQVHALMGAAALSHLATHPEGTQPGCTGADDCSAPAHLHGCYADTEGHCSDPAEHAAEHPARVLPSVEDVAEAVRGVQGVPFVGPKQRKIAAAILALFAGQPTVQQVQAEAWDQGHEAAAMRVPEGVWAATAGPCPANPYRARAAETEGE